jgi:hypothetical protein
MPPRKRVRHNEPSEFEVEKIVDKDVFDGREYYYLKWKGWDS